MNLIAQVFAGIAIVLHLFIFLLETVLFSQRRVRSLFLVPDSAAQAVRPWALNQGFYNLFLAAGPLVGLVAYHSGQTSVGRALVGYGCAFMVGCGLVLVLSDRRLWRGALLQAAPPLIALVALSA